MMPWRPPASTARPVHPSPSLVPHPASARRALSPFLPYPPQHVASRAQPLPPRAYTNPNPPMPTRALSHLHACAPPPALPTAAHGRLLALFGALPLPRPAAGFPGPIQVCRRLRPLLPRMQGFRTSATMEKNKALVQQLEHYGVVRSNKVKEIMETIDRGLFVPHGHPAYLDSPMEIGYNATISAPHMHATCLELLKEHLQPGMHALDVGSGSGYLTACFAMMVGPQGCAVGVDHIPELVAASIENVKRSAAAQLLKDGFLSLHVADGRRGWPDLAPYDAIHVGASAPEIPKPLIDQLKPGGRMVIPVGNIFQGLQVVDKMGDGSISVRTETSVRYVPLTSRAAQLQNY